MTRIGACLLAAALAVGGLPAGVGPAPLGDAAFAQGPPFGVPGPVGRALEGFGRGGPPFGMPGLAGRGVPEPFERGFERRFERRVDREFGDGFRRGPPPGVPGLGGGFAPGAGFCPPGLADKGCFPPGAQQFRQGFCPPGLERHGCMPPGLRVFGPGDVIPREIRYQRLHHGALGLPPPWPGHHYARIDRDVYLVSEATRQVVRAIGLLTTPGY